MEEFLGEQEYFQIINVPNFHLNLSQSVNNLLVACVLIWNLFSQNNFVDEDEWYFSIFRSKFSKSQESIIFQISI